MTSLNSGSVLADKYRLERPLGHGGMGAVWVARHLQLDIDVAVKLIAASAAESADARARFEREAKASAQINGPHVVQVHDYGISDGVPYLVMELLHGEDLGARLRRERRLAPAVAAGIVIQVCKALRRAHEAGIVHRDLKPGNIFLARHDDDEIVKVLDFGIAKLIDGAPSSVETTREGMLIGSPSYMSPEQVRGGGRDVDHRSDIWSLGVLLFQAMTGHLPFPGDCLGDVLVEVCTDPIPIPSRIAPDLGPEIDRFFERALARPKDQRFQSARELAEALAVLAQIGAPTWGPRAAEISVADRAAIGRSSAVPSQGDFAPPLAPPQTPFPSHGTAVMDTSDHAAAFAHAAEVRTSPGVSSTVSALRADAVPMPTGGGRAGRAAMPALIGAGVVVALCVGAFVLLRSPGAAPVAGQGAAQSPVTTGEPSAPPIVATTTSVPSVPSVATTSSATASASAPTTPAPAANGKRPAPPAKRAPAPPAAGRPGGPKGDPIFGF